MRIDKDKLRDALAVLQEEVTGTYYAGNFISLLQDSRGAQYFGTVSQKVNIHQVAKRLLLIYTDLLNIVSLSKRLELEQLLRREESMFRISDELWRWCASLDIDLFFGKYRSLFDNIAQLIKAISVNKTPNSFHELFGNAETRSLSVNQQYVQLIQKCDWFKDTKKIRDSIEHHAAESVVDYDNEKILFMVSMLDQGFTNLSKESFNDVFDAFSM